MSTLKIHSIETAPQESKPMLEGALQRFGMVPGLHGVLAESPNTYQAYGKLHELFQNSSFNNEELTVIWQTINVEHECHYCVPAHTGIAHMMKIDSALIDALRDRTEIQDNKLQVLHETTLSIVRNRGRISDAELEAFYAAGYGQKQVLEIILGIAQKTISNYTNHIANTPIDEPFKKFVWNK